MAYIDKSTQWSVTKEATYGDKTAPSLPGDVVELINPSLAGNTDLVEREVLKNSLVTAQPVLGKETSSGSCEVELSSATGTDGAKEVNGDLLFEAAMGHRIPDIAPSAGTVSAGVITFTTATDADNYEIGQAVVCSGGGGAVEYAVVRSITAGVSMTVSPAPADDQVLFGGLVSYTIAKPDAPQISLSIQEYLEATSRIEYTYGGVAVSDMTISYPVANIVKANFNLAGAGYSVEEDGVDGGVVAARSTVCSNFAPYVAKNMTFNYSNVSYDIESLEVKVTSAIYDTEALTTDGITNKTVTGKSEVGGTFSVEYTGTTLFSQYQNGTSGEIFGTVSNATSTAIVYAPKVVLTESAKSIDSGIYKEALTYRCLSSDGCSDVSEDAITIAFQ